jgi:hypothetical protein
LPTLRAGTMPFCTYRSKPSPVRSLIQMGKMGTGLRSCTRSTACAMSTVTAP